MRLGLSTACIRAVGGDPDRAIDLLCGRAGAAGVELDAGLDEAMVAALVERLGARAAELPVWAIESPCPRRAWSAASLCARERDEAGAAVAAATATLELAAEVGAGVIAVRLGEVEAMRDRWPALRRRLRRGALDDEARAAHLRERAARGAAHLDAARRSLDRLGRVADGLGVRIGVRTPARTIALPTALELRLLLDDLRGAPIDPLWDIGQVALLADLGVSVEEIAAAWESSPLVHLGDACGAVVGLGAGHGEIDLAALTRRLDADVRAVFVPWDGLDADEIALAAATLRALPTRAASETSTGTGPGRSAP